MARSARLLRLVQALRNLPAPVTAARLAEETGVSVRSLYRDIDSLRAGGAVIDGAAGQGYWLTEDPALPPQSFSRLEIEAVVLALGDLGARGDPALAEAGQAALAKIIATLPDAAQRQAMHAVAMVNHYGHTAPRIPDLTVLRQACWDESVLDIRYRDLAGAETRRRIWPLALVYGAGGATVLARCLLRQDFRQFHAHAMLDISQTAETFRPRRVPLLREYLARLRGASCRAIDPA